MDNVTLLNEAIAHHADSYHRVTEYAKKKPDGSLKAADLKRDHVCSLGNWLSTDGSKHVGLPEYATLKDAHTAFHQSAADTVRHTDGDTLPEGWLNEKGPFKASFVGLCLAVARMTFKIG